MKKLVVIVAATLLSACGSGDNGSADAVTPTPSPAAPNSPLIGVYGGTDMDGNSWTSQINADGTYTDTVGGEVSETGVWTHSGDQVCFTAQSAEGPSPAPTCLTLVNVNDDGSLLMADPEGNETTVPRLR
ncbi:hypothetical protein [Alteraurantiacibacter palmitatis]|uniref:Lipocalin-like domain-containing protein n=1 Tax=Alteraurantiacibacter palmitatis TaxID=2054628 RepID=A0ABV7E108_9SPHN